jgi:hypothetical protein
MTRDIESRIPASLERFADIGGMTASPDRTRGQSIGRIGDWQLAAVAGSLGDARHPGFSHE